MRCNRHSFYECKPLNDGFVLIENGVSCKTKGIDRIIIKMFDGTVQILTKVWHVLELRKSPISLGCFDAIGYKITMSNKVIKIGKNVMVIMKESQSFCWL